MYTIVYAWTYTNDDTLQLRFGNAPSVYEGQAEQNKNHYSASIGVNIKV